MNLFIDTAVRGCNIAFFDDNNILANLHEDIERGHAETLLLLYERLMTSLGKSPNDIKAVYVIVGPGSFTGVRVGLTVARFIGFSLNIPVLGVTSFQAFSSAIESKLDRLVLIETKRADYYCQLLNDKNQAINEAQSISTCEVLKILEKNPKVIITGDAAERFLREVGTDNINAYPQTSINTKKILSAIIGEQVSTILPEAFYIREADVSLPKQ